ncbi:MAG: nucleoside triphosphate pyrophosphatase [Roseovarius sp.]
MTAPIILASASQIRHQLLTQAGIAHQVIPARIDEEMIKSALLAEAAPPRDIADTLAEMKARKISEKHSDAMVLGCDQVLSFDNAILSKPRDPNDLRDQMTAMQGKSHQLLSAIVLYEGAKPVWREVAQVTLTMRPLSQAYLNSYIDRNWHSVQHSVGGYKLEEEGVRLFTKISGDYFSVLGLPMLGLISYLTQRGVLSA